MFCSHLLEKYLSMRWLQRMLADDDGCTQTGKNILIFFVTKLLNLRLTDENSGKEAMITDKEISEQLYEAYYMKVYSFVMTLAKSKTLSEEITQEVFFRAFTTEKTFRGESDRFTWLCAIAKNLFYDEMRKRSRQSKEIAVDITDACDDPAAAVADADASFRIHMVLHELDEPYKEVFELRCFGELSFKQIGTIFKKTESWARVTYHRAKLKIQERMDAI